MKKQFVKILLLLIIIGGVFWLGGLNIRAIIGNEFFEKGTILFRTDLSPEYERALLTMLGYSAIVTIIAYFIVFVSSISWLLLVKPNLKQNGWLMASIILFFIFTPVEFYTGYLDLKFILCFIYSPFLPDYLKTLFLQRVSCLSGLPVIATFCYYTIIAICVWRPFTKPAETDQINKN
jgi:hypothetical protein